MPLGPARLLAKAAGPTAAVLTVTVPANLTLAAHRWSHPGPTWLDSNLNSRSPGLKVTSRANHDQKNNLSPGVTGTAAAAGAAAGGAARAPHRKALSQRLPASLTQVTVAAVHCRAAWPRQSFKFRVRLAAAAGDSEA